MNKEDDYYSHCCSLNEAIYLVIVFRKYVAGSLVDSTEVYCFKEYKYAKECYEYTKTGTGYPEIIESRLIEIALHGANDLDYIYDDENEQSTCVSWSKEYNLEQTESYEYCLKKHCEINNEGCPSCENCLQYDDGNE